MQVTIFKFAGDDSLVSTNYTTLYAADNFKKLQTVSQCLTYCSVNSTCLSVTFNPITSTCYTASHTDVILLEDTELGYPVYMKSSERSQANVYVETTGLAVGRCFLYNTVLPALISHVRFITAPQNQLCQNSNRCDLLSYPSLEKEHITPLSGYSLTQ